MKYILFIPFFLQGLFLFSQNLIVNPIFENNLDGWFIETTADYNTFSLDENIFHTSPSSLKITHSESDTSLIAQLFTVEEFEKLKVGYWIKSQNLSNYFISFINYETDSDPVFNTFNSPTGNTEEWHNVFSRLTVPPDANELLLFFVFYGEGTVWLDAPYIYRDTVTTSIGFHVDFSEVSDPLKNLFQSNGLGPGNEEDDLHYVSLFQDIGIDYVRTHDFAIAFDHGTIVGLEDNSYDPFDPQAYHFDNSDEIAQNIHNAGAKLFYRFGQSYHPDPLFSSPPEDPQKWADVCVQIIKHYNEGWHDGFYYDLDYFEIWNEPDLEEFWSGSVQEYIELYRITAQKIKAYNPQLKVGGPALANVYDEHFIEEFLDSVATYNLPMDFFSYHLYLHPNPLAFKTVNDHVRQRLESHGLHDVEVINSEWNPGIFNPEEYNEFGLDDALNAANSVSALVYMQDTEIDMFFRYAFRNFWFGMVSEDVEYRYSGRALRMFRELYENGNTIYTEGGDTLGTTIIATKSELEVHILVSNNTSPRDEYNLHISGLSADFNYAYEVFRLSDDVFYEKIREGSVELTNPMIHMEGTAPYVDHIIIKSTPLSIDENNSAQFLTLYPNPTSDYIKLNFNENISSVNIEVISLEGKLVYTSSYQESAGIRLNTKSFDSGLYFIKYYTDYGSGVRKFVVR